MNKRSFQGKTILVVGGAGFVGSNLAHRLVAEKPAKLIIVDNLLSADISNVPTDACVDFRFGSITNDQLLHQLPDTINFVLHLSTYHGNQSSMHDPLADHENNTFTTLKLLERLKSVKGIEAVVYSSAGCTVAQKTFDEAKPTTEDDPVSLYLDSPYQMSKIFGEFYGNYYWMRYGIPFIKARFQNVYGPREILGAGQWRGTPATVWRNVTPTFIWKALHNEPLPLDKGGVATRDFIYVDDIVAGLIACAANGEAGGVYNIASGVETSIKDLADTVNRLTGNKAAVAIMEARPWDRSGKRFGETSKAERELGFIPKVALEDGLTATVKWTKENMATIERCVAQHARYLAPQKVAAE